MQIIVFVGIAPSEDLFGSQAGEWGERRTRRRQHRGDEQTRGLKKRGTLHFKNLQAEYLLMLLYHLDVRLISLVTFHGCHSAKTLHFWIEWQLQHQV